VGEGIDPRDGYQGAKAGFIEDVLARAGAATAG